MSTLRATNIKNPDSGDNNIVLDGSGGVIISGVTTSSNFVGNVTGNATGLSGTPNLNVGVVTASSFVGNVTGNATGLTGTPNLNVGVVTSTSFVVGSAVTITSGGINAGVATITSTLDLSQSTTGIALPQGTTTQRPTGNNPYIRYNTTNSALEFYNGTDWVEIISDYFPSGSTILG